MTKKEYDKIINILYECMETVYVTPYYTKRYISNDKIPVIKERIKELVEDKQ